MADHIQQVFSNFETNQQLAQEAQNFGNFLNVRSQFDQQYLSQYDPLSLQADTGPSDLLKHVPNWVTGTSSIVEGYCGDAVFTAEQNVQKPYSQCAPCNSIYCAQQAASAQGCPIASQGSMAVLGPGGRSKYDLQYDSQYEKLSMGADTNFAGHGAQPNWVTGTRIITGGGTPQPRPRSLPPQPRPRSLPPQPRPTSREGYAPGSEKKGALKGMHPAPPGPPPGPPPAPGPFGPGPVPSPWTGPAYIWNDQCWRGASCARGPWQTPCGCSKCTPAPMDACPTPTPTPPTPTPPPKRGYCTRLEPSSIWLDKEAPGCTNCQQQNVKKNAAGQSTAYQNCITAYSWEDGNYCKWEEQKCEADDHFCQYSGTENSLCLECNTHSSNECSGQGDDCKRTKCYDPYPTPSPFLNTANK